MASYSEYTKKFDIIHRWVIDDLTRSSILAHANLLVSMGIFNYIEMLGSFCKPNYSNTKRFNYALNNLFPPKYTYIYKRLHNITDKGVYNCLRCGMSHEYLVKSYNKNKSTSLEFTVFGVNNKFEFEYFAKQSKPGLILESKKNNLYYLKIINPKLINDLDYAFAKFKDNLANNKRGYRNNFLKRCKEIHLENLN